MQISSIQKILVPLDLSPYAAAATNQACSISQRHHAQVEGTVVLDYPEIMGLDIPFQAWMRPEALELSEKRAWDASQRISGALARFAEICERRGVPHNEATFQGAPADRILEAASFHDLIVMGLRTYFHFETQDDAGDSLEKVLRAPTAPVLAVPQAVPHEGDSEWKKVHIAFDGSPNASRALKEFAQFAQPYEFEITVLMAAEDKNRAEAIVDSAASYLRAHHLENIKTLVTEDEILDVFTEEFIADSDLIVAGIHSRRYLKDFFVGSLVRQLIDYGKTPIFLS